MSNKDKILDAKYSNLEIQQCIDLLEDLVKNSAHMAHLSLKQRLALLKVTGYISRPNREEFRQRRKESKKLQKQKHQVYEKKVRAATGIRSAREETVFKAPLQITDAGSQKVLQLIKPRACYVCKTQLSQVHFFSDSMCPRCAEFNYAKRFQTASLEGHVALITGSRLKIGYQASLMMLRAGAMVIATTRFPIDSALRYSKEEDFDLWKHRLHIYGLDLRHTPSVELFCTYVQQNYDRLDILINNAAQTVRRPPGFYAHLMANELKDFDGLPDHIQSLLRPFEMCKNKITSQNSSNSKDLVPTLSWGGKITGMGLSASAKLSQIPYVHDHNIPAEKVFPKGKLDADLQQVDLRDTNSWRLVLGEISTAEMIELQLVNSIAPFVLCNKLTAMMKRDNTGKKHMVNVSAMEGKFHRYTKTDRHPHTNMAKAALNMLVRTSSIGLEKDGIFMNAVDTGWVTDEDPIAFATQKKENLDFQPPLDIVDGAARVCDPFFDGILTGKHWSGKFLKDYYPVDW